MRTYIIPQKTAPLPKLRGEVFDPEREPFCRGEYAAIDRYAWGGDYRPEARAYLAWDAAGLLKLRGAAEGELDPNDPEKKPSGKR